MDDPKPGCSYWDSDEEAEKEKRLRNSTLAAIRNPESLYNEILVAQIKNIQQGQLAGTEYEHFNQSDAKTLAAKITQGVLDRMGVGKEDTDVPPALDVIHVSDDSEDDINVNIVNTIPVENRQRWVVPGSPRSTFSDTPPYDGTFSGSSSPSALPKVFAESPPPLSSSSSEPDVIIEVPPPQSVPTLEPIIELPPQSPKFCADCKGLGLPESMYESHSSIEIDGRSVCSQFGKTCEICAKIGHEKKCCPQFKKI